MREIARRGGHRDEEPADGEGGEDRVAAGGGRAARVLPYRADHVEQVDEGGGAAGEQAPPAEPLTLTRHLPGSGLAGLPGGYVQAASSHRAPR